MDAAKDPNRHYIESKFAIAGHPVHAMLVTFPIALACGTLGADLFWWWTADPFFARLAVWTAGWGFGLGVVAAASGLFELLLVRGIRVRAEAWNHGVAALWLVAVLGANWGLRLAEPTLVLPWGLYLSVLGFVSVGFAGWHGGKLVFEHQIGVSRDTHS